MVMFFDRGSELSQLLEVVILRLFKRCVSFVSTLSVVLEVCTGRFSFFLLIEPGLLGGGLFDCKGFCSGTDFLLGSGLLCFCSSLAIVFVFLGPGRGGFVDGFVFVENPFIPEFCRWFTATGPRVALGAFWTLRKGVATFLFPSRHEF